MNKTVALFGTNAPRMAEIAADLNRDGYKTNIFSDAQDIVSTRAHPGVAAIILFYSEIRDMAHKYLETDKAKITCECRAPLIVCSDNREDHNEARVKGIEADEFLIQPNSAREFSAAIVSVCAHFHENAATVELRVGDLAINRKAASLTLRGELLRVDSVYVRILEALIARPGQVLSRAQIAKYVWGPNNSYEDQTIDAYISRLRIVLARKVSVDPIRTVRGIGYAFNENFALQDSRPSNRPGIRKPIRKHPSARRSVSKAD